MRTCGFEIFKINLLKSCHEAVMQACVNIRIILRASLEKSRRIEADGITTIYLCTV